MVACPSCSRHAKVQDKSCPFCGAALPPPVAGGHGKPESAEDESLREVTVYGAPAPRFMERPAYGGPMRRRAHGKKVLLVFLLFVLVGMALILFFSLRGR
jgi:hypothetical protein